MLEKLGFIEKKYDELNQRIMDPELVKDLDEYQSVMKEHSDIENYKFNIKVFFHNTLVFI